MNWLGMKMVLDMNQEGAWERFRNTLVEHGSDGATARQIWGRVQFEPMGQVDPISGGKPMRDFLQVEALLEGEDEPPSFPVDDEKALVWIRMDRDRGEVMLGMYHWTE